MPRPRDGRGAVRESRYWRYLGHQYGYRYANQFLIIGIHGCRLHSGHFTESATLNANPRRPNYVERLLLPPGRNVKPMLRKHCLRRGTFLTKNLSCPGVHWVRSPSPRPHSPSCCRAYYPPLPDGYNTAMQNPSHPRFSQQNTVRPSRAHVMNIEQANGNYANYAIFY